MTIAVIFMLIVCKCTSMIYFNVLHNIISISDFHFFLPHVAYIQNNFDQFNGPTILMPYRNAPTTGDIDVIDSDGENDIKLN